MDSKWLKISLIAILFLGVVFVYYAYTTASTIDVLKTLKTLTGTWNPFSDIVREVVDTIINMLKRAVGVV
ncbi:MAG: hypothetical protein ACTSV0_09430 [Candidatus Freyarchaeota archaeon]